MLRGLAGVVLGCGCVVGWGCTRPNPAFELSDTESTGDAATSKPTSTVSGADDDDDGDGGPGTLGGDATTGEPPVTDADGPGWSTGEPPAATSDTGATDGGNACSVRESPPFSIEVSDEQNVAVDLPCDATTTIAGTVVGAMNGDTWVIEVCDTGTCACAAQSTMLTVTFMDLEPGPPGVVDLAATACIVLSIRTNALAAGCGIAATFIESGEGETDFPLYIATNGLDAGSLLLPTISLGDAIETCANATCPGLLPGTYELMFGDTAIAPGSSAEVTMNPFASVATTYDVYDRFSYVDEACKPHIGWTAAWAG